MPVAATLSFYVARQFTVAVVAMLAAQQLDEVEQRDEPRQRRAAPLPDVRFSLVVAIAALRLPYFSMEIMPFAVLLGGIIAFWRLTRSSELIVARAAGVSAWQFLAAPLGCALMLGLAATTLVSPLSSMMFARAETLEQTYLTSTPGQVQLAGGELWLRQLDEGIVPSGVAILHAHAVHLRGKRLVAQGVSVFRLDGADRLLSRIEANSAVLQHGAWDMQNARTLKPDSLPVPAGRLELPTDFTVRRVQESFASPDTLSVWALPGFIARLQHSGFSAIRHRLHYQSLLAAPLLAGTMALVAAGFSMRPARRGGVSRMIGSGIGAGFALFTVSKVAEEFGRSGALPPMLAAWAPAAAGLLFALALLLHLEDG